MSLFAYLDPGSGSIILQTLLGGAAAVLVAIKMFGKRVYRFVFFWRDHDEDESKPPAAQHETEKEPV